MNLQKIYNKTTQELRLNGCVVFTWINMWAIWAYLARHEFHNIDTATKNALKPKPLKIILFCSLIVLWAARNFSL